MVILARRIKASDGWLKRVFSHGNPTVPQNLLNLRQQIITLEAIYVGYVFWKLDGLSSEKKFDRLFAFKLSFASAYSFTHLTADLLLKNPKLGIPDQFL